MIWNNMRIISLGRRSRSELGGRMEIRSSLSFFFPLTCAHLRVGLLQCMEMRWPEHRSCALEIQLEFMLERLCCNVTVWPCSRLRSSRQLSLTCNPDLRSVVNTFPSLPPAKQPDRLQPHSASHPDLWPVVLGSVPDPWAAFCFLSPWLVCCLSAF